MPRKEETCHPEIPAISATELFWQAETIKASFVSQFAGMI